MGYPQKIVTCCYCGTRAALVLKGKDRHELSCSACGAPLHDLKMLRTDKRGDRDLVSPGRSKKTRHRNPQGQSRHDKPRKGKRRKGLVKKFFEEAFDVLEDIFD